jgi:hypothetical protein
LSFTGAGVFLYVACTELGPQARKNNSSPGTPSDPTVDVFVSCCVQMVAPNVVYKGINDPHAYIMLVTIVLLCFVRYRIATVRNVESTKFDGIIQRHMFDRFISALQVIFSPSVGQSLRISFDWTFQNGHVDQFGEDTVFCSPKKKHGVYSVFPPQKMT